MAKYVDFNKLCNSLYGVAPDDLVVKPNHHCARAVRYEKATGQPDDGRQELAPQLLDDWICYDAWPGPAVEPEVKLNSCGIIYSSDDTVKWTLINGGTLTIPANAVTVSLE